MKKYFIRLGLWVIGLITVACAGYLGLSLYYKNTFMLNTWINGVYCTGMTIEEVNEELVARMQPPASLTVVGWEKATLTPEEYTWELPLKDMGYVYDFRDSITQFFEEREAFLWVDNISYHDAHYYTPTVTYDENLISEWWQQVAQTGESEEAFKIVYSEEDGYSLYDGIFNRLDVEKAYQTVLDAVASGDRDVSLIETGCYYNIPVTQEHFAIRSLWEKIDLFQSNGPVYNIGDKMMRIEPSVMASFLIKEDAEPCLPILDGDGNLQLDEEMVAEFVNELAAENDTYGKVWDFETTAGEKIAIQGGTYGTTLDCDHETAWLIGYLEQLIAGDIESLDTQVHSPVYIRDAYSHSFSSIGKTYIEVDMGRQKLYYYERGVLRLETDVVTGNLRRRMNTPEGVNYVYAKQKNRVLRGADYATPVKFWMPVKGSIGIHDANWRKEFGGEIYKTDGSHGCINVPPAVMPELYEMVEIGTPVVMFYGEDS